jgi:hypothetical protein
LKLKQLLKFCFVDLCNSSFIIVDVIFISDDPATERQLANATSTVQYCSTTSHEDVTSEYDDGGRPMVYTEGRKVGITASPSLA